MNGTEWGTFDKAELRMLLNRLERSELDFQTRLAQRVEALGGCDPSISDPLYQRHYFALEALKAQLAAVEGELSARAQRC